MAKKQKNPLYVVKGKNVEEANSILDLIIKKLNLEPVLRFLGEIINMLLAQANSYPFFVALKNFVDLLVSKLELFAKFKII